MQKDPSEMIRPGLDAELNYSNLKPEYRRLKWKFRITANPYVPLFLQWSRVW